MKPNRSHVVAVGATFFLMVGLGACHSKPVEKSPIPVKVAAVELHTAGTGTRYSATIIPRTQVELAFKVGGYVAAIQQVRGVDGTLRDLQEGDRITAGAALAQVRRSDYEAKVKAAESQAHEAKTSIGASEAQFREALSAVAASQAQLAEAEAAYEKAKLDFARAQNLLASRSLTKANFDAAKAQLETAQAKTEAARSQVAMLQAKAEAAKSQINISAARSQGAEAVVQQETIPLQDTALKAPLNGVVLHKSVEKGTLVVPGTTGFIVADMASVKAVFGVPDLSVPDMKPGKTLRVETEAMPGTKFEGTITSVFPAADPKSRAFNVEVTIANPDYLLRSGMIVSLTVREEPTLPSQPVVPLNAILKARHLPDGYAVFVVTEQDGRPIAQLRDVKLGEAYGRTVAVTDGVKPGDRVITTGGTLVTDGAQVQVIP